MQAQRGNSHRIEKIKEDLVFVESSVSRAEQVSISLKNLAYPDSASE